MNDRVGAIRIYRNLQKALNSEFGVEPSGELKEKISGIKQETRETA
jgi:DNA-binding SARP family transcriptional activator